MGCGSSHDSAPRAVVVADAEIDDVRRAKKELAAATETLRRYIEDKYLGTRDGLGNVRWLSSVNIAQIFRVTGAEQRQVALLPKGNFALNLSDLSINDGGLEEIVQMILPVAHKLSTLNIEHNEITDKGALFLLHTLLPKCTALEWLGCVQTRQHFGDCKTARWAR